MDNKEGQFSSMMRTLSRQLKVFISERLALPTVPPTIPPRVLVVNKIVRNALSELVGRARSHPQPGEIHSSNPAYVALAELALNSGRPSLALGLRHETGEITFLDFDLDADKLEDRGDAFVGRVENLSLWHRLEELIYKKVDHTMVGPRKPIRPPEEVTYENR